MKMKDENTFETKETSNLSLDSSLICTSLAVNQLSLFVGTNFFQVFTHEIGHSLGISHSEVEDAIMFAYYRGYDPDFENLHPDDTSAVQAIYGKCYAAPSF